jgi:ATP synthase F1 delta subunit
MSSRSVLQSSSQSVGNKYAISLYRAAKRQNVFRQVEADMTRFKLQIESEGHKLKNLITSPLLSNSQKQRIITPITSKLDQSSTVARFIDLIAANGRLSSLMDIVGAFMEICEAQKQCLNVLITSSKVGIQVC